MQVLIRLIPLFQTHSSGTYCKKTTTEDAICPELIFLRKNKTSLLVGCQRKSVSGQWLVSLQAKGTGLLHSNQQFLIQHGVGGVRWKVQAVEARVSPEREERSESE